VPHLLKEESMKNRMVMIFIFVLMFVFCFSFGANAAGPKKCKESSDCTAKQFCDTSPKCPDGKNKGVCINKPELCTKEYMPVKGCDGKVYPNRCQAKAAGQPDTGPVRE
jgi:hypothetical protein